MELIREALYGAPPSVEYVRMLSAMDMGQWRLLADEARRQTVTGLLFLAVDRLPEDISVPEDIGLDLMMSLDDIVRRNLLVSKVEALVLSKLREAGLEPVVMKGSTCAARYPVPGYRESGDIDLFIPSYGIDKTAMLLSKDGYSIGHGPDGSLRCCIETVEIDIHGEYYDFCGTSASLPPVPSPEAELVMLSAHILKHATGPGVGLRQICDYALALHCYKGDRLKLETAICNAGLEKWDRLLNTFIRDYLAPGNKRVTKESKPLFRIIARGGDFGHHDYRRQGALQGPAIRRKADTFMRIILKIPFALRYAPAMSVKRIVTLSINQRLRRQSPFCNKHS